MAYPHFSYTQILLRLFDIGSQATRLLFSFESPDTLLLEDYIYLFQRFATCLLEEKKYVDRSGKAKCAEYTVDLWAMSGVFKLEGRRHLPSIEYFGMPEE